MKTINQWIEILEPKSIGQIKVRLRDTLESIAFLESIYMTGGANNFYGQVLKDAAYNEQQELCKLSSACYSLIRKMEVTI